MGVRGVTSKCVDGTGGSQADVKSNDFGRFITCTMHRWVVCGMKAFWVFNTEHFWDLPKYPT